MSNNLASNAASADLEDENVSPGENNGQNSESLRRVIENNSLNSNNATNSGVPEMTDIIANEENIRLGSSRQQSKQQNQQIVGNTSSAHEKTFNSLEENQKVKVAPRNVNKNLEFPPCRLNKGMPETNCVAISEDYYFKKFKFINDENWMTLNNETKNGTTELEHGARVEVESFLTSRYEHYEEQKCFDYEMKCDADNCHNTVLDNALETSKHLMHPPTASLDYFSPTYTIPSDRPSSNLLPK